MEFNNQYQAANNGQPAGIPPQNNMVLAILATVFSILCCGIQSLVTLPLGIIAIMKANDVNKLFLGGYEFQARESAKNAKTYSIISLCITAVFFVISLIVWLFVGYNGLLEKMGQV